MLCLMQRPVILQHRHTKNFNVSPTTFSLFSHAVPVTAVGVEIHTPLLVAVYCRGMQQSIDVSRLSTKSLLICIEPQRDVTGHNSIYPQ